MPDPTPTILDRSVVYSSGGHPLRGSCAFPGVCVLPGGRWLCSFRAAPTKSANAGQHVLVTWSNDCGRTWAPPFEPFTPPMLAGRPGAFRAAGLTALGGRDVLAVLCWVDQSDQVKPFFNETTQGLLDMRIFLSRSRDDGQTWGLPSLVDTSPLDCPVPITGPILRMPSGELACQFELNKHYDDPSVWRHRSVLMFSKDGGRTWPDHVFTSADPENRVFYWDQRPAVMRDGRILDLFWTYDTVTATYLNIHARRSDETGRQWSDLWDTGVAGQPAPPFDLPGDRIGMVFVDRAGAPQIKMRVSADRGRTWPSATETTLSETADVSSQTRDKKTMQDAWSEMGAFSVGLPCTAVLPGGEVLVVYYAGPHPDRTAIHWVLVGAGP
jgi:hypothetical protein